MRGTLSAVNLDSRLRGNDSNGAGMTVVVRE
jgi:hypothetical protein